MVAVITNSLIGKQIPLAARIFTIVDAYDVITSERPYKQPLKHEEAVRRIVEDSGRHFDPYIVKVFVKIEDKFKKINDKYNFDKITIFRSNLIHNANLVVE